MSDLIKTRKGIFIPDITVEIFRNASLEAVEELLVSGEMQDIILPSAEPEIIRCRDCKYSQMTDDDECRYCKIWFAEEEHFLPGNYFCADAERKEECMP